MNNLTILSESYNINNSDLRELLIQVSKVRNKSIRRAGYYFIYMLVAALNLREFE